MGYVGFPAAILLAKAGHKVVGVDVNEEVVRQVNAGVLHIDEQELQAILAARTCARTCAGSRRPGSRMLAYQSRCRRRWRTRGRRPTSPWSSRPARRSRPICGGALVVLESTVPPLTCQRVMTPILERGGLKVGKDILLAHCPERILPGNVFHEIVHNDRIIGGVDQASTDAAAALYSSFVKGELIRTDDVTAELCKLTENTYRDVNIALANELAMVCAKLGVDVHKVIGQRSRHPRVDFLKPGIGVGGHCIPIDPWFITEVDPESSVLIATARRINDRQPARVAPAHSARGSRRDRAADPLRRGVVQAAAECDCVAVLVPHRSAIEPALPDPRVELERAMRRRKIVDLIGAPIQASFAAGDADGARRESSAPLARPSQIARASFTSA